MSNGFQILSTSSVAGTALSPSACPGHLGLIFPPTITVSLHTMNALRLRQGPWTACVMCVGKSIPVSPTEHWEIVCPGRCPSPFILPSRGLIGLLRWDCHRFPRRPLLGTSWLALPFTLFLNVALKNTHTPLHLRGLIYQPGPQGRNKIKASAVRR